MTLHQPFLLRDLDTGQALDGIVPGEPVVHAASGVGRYHGLVAMELGGTAGEFVEVDYADDGTLYVPVQRIDQLTRYRGGPADKAPLHALGSDAWARACRRALERAQEAARALLALQAQREATTREPPAVDRAELDAFAASFGHTPTPDQRAAIDAVLADLAGPHPMDRIVCGDVGFGKTEIALRAAFAVARAGRQVAVLVPTTLLAQQHYQRFRERFADWPIQVSVISRFRSGRRLDETLARLADGRLDIIIGTHKLLQPQVRFHRLGLVVVDEEQRFGVQQKERLKALDWDVDVLTLSATPIPRTLSMALAGLRDLSLVTTAPGRRRPVRTTLSRWDAALITEAVQRELDRQGQAFVLHNAVESLDAVAARIAALVPAARIAVAHGQMDRAELRRVMAAFRDGRHDVLVCTTIIETGIDIPRANTIVIDRAEQFGLAQLQQLRGRVGRSSRQAYAYLLIDDPAAMTDEAVQRLQAFADSEDLGAGFQLAAQDLEIRGAGELLGKRQSGQIRQVGLAMYQRLLAEAVAALKAGRAADPQAALGGGVEIELHRPALVPAAYVPEVPVRLALYQRIARATEPATLDTLETELSQRFGPIPPETRQLLLLSRLRLRAAALGMRRLDLAPEGGHASFDEAAASFAPEALERLVRSAPGRYERDGRSGLRIIFAPAREADLGACAEHVLSALESAR